MFVLALSGTLSSFSPSGPTAANTLIANTTIQIPMPAAKLTRSFLPEASAHSSVTTGSVQITELEMHRNTLAFVVIMRCPAAYEPGLRSWSGCCPCPCWSLERADASAAAAAMDAAAFLEAAADAEPPEDMAGHGRLLGWVLDGGKYDQEQDIPNPNPVTLTV